MPAHPMIMLVDDEPTQLAVLRRWLEARDLRVSTHATAADALGALDRVIPDLVLLDVHLDDGDGHEVDGLEVLEQLQQAVPKLPVVMLTAEQSVDSVVRAVRAGALDYLTKPVPRRRLYEVVERALGQRREHLAEVGRARTSGDTSYGMLGTSSPMRTLFDQIDRVGQSQVSVVIRGESGTGKELVARALHAASTRASGPFIAVNCGAIPDNLQESELFGHVRGAFTGADRDRVGRMEQADGGTLFLDEVAELSPSLQATLLRALQERRFYPVGGDREKAVDIRVLAASHQDLLAAAHHGRFREDLYYRLAVVELTVPPLRDRGDDAVELARRFLAELSNGRLTLSDEAAQQIRRHDWPGNVRELRNAMERAAVLAAGETVGVADLPPRMLEHTTSDEALEREELQRALEAHDGNVTEVVETLGIPRSTLYRRLKKHGLR